MFSLSVVERSSESRWLIEFFLGKESEGKMTEKKSPLLSLQTIMD